MSLKTKPKVIAAGKALIDRLVLAVQCNIIVRDAPFTIYMNQADFDKYVKKKDKDPYLSIVNEKWISNGNTYIRIMTHDDVKVGKIVVNITDEEHKKIKLIKRIKDK